MRDLVQKQHFYWLDAIRFVAAFIVLLSHSRNTFFPMFSNLPVEQQNLFSMVFTLFCRMGHEAVIVFFVLSGFLVGGRGFERIYAGDFNVSGYLINRVSRIYPPLLMAVLFYYFTSIVIPETTFSWTIAVGNIFNLQGICCSNLVGPFWSLSYEVWFYIVLCTLAIALLAKNNRMKFIGFSLFGTTVMVFVLGLKMHYLLIWMMGAVAYLVRPTKKNTFILWSSIFGFFAACVLWQLSKDTHSLKVIIQSVNKDFLELVMSLMVCILIQQVILFKPKCKFSVVIEKYLGRMAKFSYTLYLSHQIVLLWIIAYIWPEATCDFTLIGMFKYCSILIMSLIICWLLYLISEKQSNRIKLFLKGKFL